ncbi:DUF4062 domain-containing protein [Citrobacter freundii]|jgi:hypothetical protein|uniref:DUF4062 domain-containing protein n=1 Tax=Citrobacter freundii TaxID=546 RepID=UPI0015EAA1BB|nr:DUF4062 domain-containing protein [Citrobacter freundii]QMB05537.1 DUF4062 domain-containing protein [Citrobacter freundii]
MDKRYQVFVSSTFTDLEEERKHVIQTLMELDCIPAGMELFPAIDESQWKFIQKIIDDCDYYLLIIGGRYGTVAEDGLSYTEKEFDYALSKGLRVVVLVHEDPESLPLAKSEKDSELRIKLKAFADKASTGRLHKKWTTAKDLPGLVALSISKTIKTYPAIGWVRADQLSNESDLRDLIDLKKENDRLKGELDNIKRQRPRTEELNLADMDDPYEFTCESSFTQNGRTRTLEWVTTMTWSEIFTLISPFLVEYSNETSVSRTIAQEAKIKESKGGTSPKVIPQNLKTIAIQLQAYGLIKVENLKTTSGNYNLFWSLTDLGHSKMVGLRTIKKQEVNQI